MTTEPVAHLEAVPLTVHRTVVLSTVGLGMGGLLFVLFIVCLWCWSLGSAVGWVAGLSLWFGGYGLVLGYWPGLYCRWVVPTQARDPSLVGAGIGVVKLMLPQVPFARHVGGGLGYLDVRDGCLLYEGAAWRLEAPDGSMTGVRAVRSPLCGVPELEVTVRLPEQELTIYPLFGLAASRMTVRLPEREVTLRFALVWSLFHRTVEVWVHAMVERLTIEQTKPVP